MIKNNQNFFLAVLPIATILISYVVPAYLIEWDIDFLTNPMLDGRYIDAAKDYAVAFLFIYALLLAIPIQITNGSKKLFNKKTKIIIQSSAINLFFTLICSLLCHMFFVIGAGGYDSFLSPAARFSVEYPLARTAGTVFGIISIILYLTQRKFLFIILLLLCINSATYAFTISSRSVAVPFLLAAFILFYKKNYLLTVTISLLAVFLYIDAILNRSTLGAEKILSLLNILPLLESMSFIIFIFYDTFAAFQTLTVAFSVGQQSTFPSNLDFLYYISPVPSLMFDVASYIKFQSLSYHMNIQTGINSDVLSETYLWFGWVGAIVAAIIFFLMYRVITIFNWGRLYPLIVLSFFYFCVMANVASIRASSRPFIYLVMIAATLYVFRRFSRYLKSSRE